MTPVAVLTRPEGSNEPLAALLAAQGWATVVQPMLRIEPLPAAQRSPVPDLPAGSLCIFISANAAEIALPHLITTLTEGNVTCCAVGSKTAAVLNKAGIAACVPQRPDSEGLLALPELTTVAGKTVLMVKGEGGRGLLAKTLQERGAHVIDYVGYRRVAADVPENEFKAKLLAAESLVFQANSGETLEALTHLLARINCQSLMASAVVVPSERVAQLAQTLGWRTILTATDAGDHALLDALGIEQPSGIIETSEEISSAAHIPEPPASDREVLSSDKETALEISSTPLGNTASANSERVTPTRRDGLARALLLLLLSALIAAGAASYLLLWPQWLARAQALTLLEQQVTDAVASQAALEQRLAKQLASGLLTAQTEASSALQEQLTAAAQARAEREVLAAQLTDRLERLELQLARLTATDRRGWLTQEAAFLIRLASQRLLASRDVAAARALLMNADRLLAEASDPRLAKARTAIARDITRLASAPTVDTVGIYARFAALIEQASQLKVVPDVEPISIDTHDGSLWQRAATGWQQALNRLSNYLIIRRHTDRLAPLMTPDWEALVRQNLRMLLEQAQIAALSANQTLYDQALDRAAVFAAEFGASDPRATESLLTTLSTLAAEQIAPPLPDLVSSEGALADALRLLNAPTLEASGAARVSAVPGVANDSVDLIPETSVAEGGP